MDNLTTALAGVPLEPTNSDTTSTPAETRAETRINRAFQEITAYAALLRPGPIPGAEIAVTRALAEPFTPGGLVILLLEPRADHPWEDGVHTVVEECLTLDVLREFIEESSGGEISMIEDVSVVDLRPYIDKDLREDLSTEELWELYDLVYDFICAKQPDVILAMGYEAGCELGFQLDMNGDRLPRETKTVYARHPSYAVNYHWDSLEKQEALFEHVSTAVELLGQVQLAYVLERM
ncbi:hypothetical protein BDV18DRAFT_160282 [Aspergillus unguis]